MNITRYITILAVKTTENEIIPIWDERITYDKSKDTGAYVNIRGEHRHQYDAFECIYDLKTKTVSIGIDVDIYPDKKETEFSVGQKVMCETSHRKLEQTTVKDIIFKSFDLYIKRGKNLESYYKKHIEDFNVDSLYAIKMWKPFYVLENGKTIEYTHQLYHISE